MKPKSVTLNDVADYAGVSYQTVSRVLNRAEHVSGKTRAKVEQAMAALNYVPNRVAQQLAGKQSFTLGLATTELALHAPSQIASAIKTQANQMGFNVVISMVEDLSVQACRSAINELLAQRVDGLLINVSLSTEDSHAIVQACGEVPALFLDVDPASEVSSILFDPHEGARQGVEHVVALGHREIALITGPLVSISARLRYQGWLATLAEHQLEPCSVLHGDWSAVSGYQLTGQILNLPKHPTAILVANDQMALGVLRALQEYGLQIPAQVSVVGYDDTEDSACYYPPLTTIKQDFRMLGQESVKHLVQCLEGRNRPQAGSLRLATRLVQRHTTAAVYQEKVQLQCLSQELLRIARQLSALEAK
ncbi:LacI family DNA-binding transcriptional regulator [Serratia oryzae]|uniref:Lac repressor n=1 Tax=Serratia oryzae TaxID=2034155 RepID=A0A1S8CJ30_9GAMM|nr:LacI family DNA-binding transcriptional regulator [Serratia oryzae]OMQ21867.1 lac repressor [Serratia oryzae]VXC95006.1 DNA-binding transcriptional repressor [Enterobacterales bacterium 8AC]